MSIINIDFKSVLFNCCSSCFHSRLLAVTQVIQIVVIISYKLSTNCRKLIKFIDNLWKAWSNHILVTPTSYKLRWGFHVVVCDVFQKVVTRDQIVTVVITWSQRVKSVEHCWNVRSDFQHIRSLPDKNSFSTNQKVRKLQESWKSTIYHIFLTKQARQLCCGTF